MGKPRFSCASFSFLSLFVSACSPSYNIGSYIKYREINSQINEQQNSSTKNLARQVSYMTGRNFMEHLTFFMWKRNEEKKERWREIKEKEPNNLNFWILVFMHTCNYFADSVTFSLSCCWIRQWIWSNRIYCNFYVSPLPKKILYLLGTKVKPYFGKIKEARLATGP